VEKGGGGVMFEVVGGFPGAVSVREPPEGGRDNTPTKRKHRGGRRLQHGFWRGFNHAEGTKHIQATEDLLKQTKELLAVKSAELSVAQTFLSTTDDLSEEEVLQIVSDLNENIYQVASGLAEEWEKSKSSQATSRMDGLASLLQSCLCSYVVSMTSSWGHYKELAALDSIYQLLSASGEHLVCPSGT